VLIRFRVENFRSLRDEQQLSMVASLRADRADLVRAQGPDLDLLRVAAIYGPNASGKSNVLSALEFMHAAVAGSHGDWEPEGAIPTEPFALDPAARSRPSFFEADVLIDGVRYQYGFKLNTERVLEEWLYAYPKGRRQVWFLRNADAPEPFTFGKRLRGRNRIIGALTRKNSLFLSVAAENNHQALLAVYSWFAGRPRFSAVAYRGEGFQAVVALVFGEGR